MQNIIHKSDSRPYYDHGWLKTRHSFSFARYYNPERIHFGKLRVINDDLIEGGMGFDKHPHDNMEIITIPLSGALAHTDSEGHKEVIRPGDVQIMSAGTGLYHAEFNHEKYEPVTLLQIWIIPKKRDIQPRYDQKTFDFEKNRNRLVSLVSPQKSEETLWINQDAYLSLGWFDHGSELSYKLNKKDNGVYLFIIEGSATIENIGKLTKRDAVGIWDTDVINLTVNNKAQLLFIEVPM